MSKGITSQKDNYATWYTDVIIKSGLADYGPVKGTMVIKPYGYELWENIKSALDKMLKDNFFGTKDKDMMNYALIDKINLYYKSSKRLDFKFTKKENYFVDAVNSCKSFDDVLKLAEDILGHCKEEIKKQPKIAKIYTPIPDPSAEKKDGESTETESDSGSNDDSKDSKDFIVRRGSSLFIFLLLLN